MLIAQKLGAGAGEAAAVRTLREVEGAIEEKYGPGLKGKVRRDTFAIACFYS